MARAKARFENDSDNERSGISLVSEFVSSDRCDDDSLRFSSDELRLLVTKLEDVLDAIQTRRRIRDDNEAIVRRRVPSTCFRKLWAWIVKYFLAATTVWQIACITLLSVIEAVGKKKEKELSENLLAGTIILTFCQAVLIFVVICMSVKITKQYMHMTLTPWFLFQTYLSSILLFTGVYTLFVRISPSSFKHVGQLGHGIYAFEIYSKMLFFSVSTGTLCGVSLTFPNAWYAYITVAIQMLLSFIYFASILSVVITATRSRKKRSSNNERTGLLNRSSYGTADNTDHSLLHNEV